MVTAFQPDAFQNNAFQIVVQPFLRCTKYVFATMLDNGFRELTVFDVSKFVALADRGFRELTVYDVNKFVNLTDRGFRNVTVLEC